MKAPAAIVRSVRRISGAPTAPLPSWARVATAVPAVSAPDPAAPSSPTGLRLGDLVHTVALPIARALKLPCVDPATKQLRPESKCAQRRRRWNGEPPAP